MANNVNTVRVGKIVRAFVTQKDTVYNDKIKNGRSIKIVGYTVEDYKKIVGILETEGFTVKVTKKTRVMDTWNGIGVGIGGGEYRIHVK